LSASSTMRTALAASIAASALGVADATIALARSPATIGESLVFLWQTVASLQLVLVPSAIVGHALVARVAPRSSTVRSLVGLALGLPLGAMLGLAAFSGSAMRHSPIRPWLIATCVIVAAAASVITLRLAPSIAARAAARPRVTASIMTAIALLVGYGHATMLVRLYPALHAMAAMLVALAAVIAARAMLSSLARPQITRLKSWVLIVAVALLSFSAMVTLLRSQRARARARQHAPFSTYVVRAASRLTTERSASATVDDDRFVEGPSLDLEGLDVLLITVDALRWDRLGAYGHRGGLTPAIDALARRGVVVERAYCTTPHTSYSLASLMTGKYFRGVSALGTQRRHETIASQLRSRGYATAAFFPPAVFAVDAERLSNLRTDGFGFTYREEEYASARDRVSSALRWLEQRPSHQRTFLWVHLFEPHESYEAHPGSRVPGGASVASRYDSEIAAVDDAVQALIDGYQRLRRRSAIFITADHGEEFGEHGGRFHGTTLYDEQVRVPLILFVPGLAPRRVRGPASHVDLLPTLIAGVGAPRPPRLRGRDLGPLAHGIEARRAIFASVGAERMVFDGTFKLLCDVNENTCELYDLSSDPLEQNNLADARPDVLARLRPMIAGWDASHAAFEREDARDDERAQDELPPVVERAIQGDRAAAVEAARTLASLDAAKAIRAVRALASLGVRDAPVLDALARASRRNALDLSREAGVALARLGDERGRQSCLDALSSAELASRRAAALGLATLGQREGVPILAAWLNDRSAQESERDAALRALRALRDPRAFDSYVALLDDPRLAPEGAHALRELGDPRAIEPLVALARGTRYALTRNASLLALASLGAPQAAELTRDALGSEPAPTEPFTIVRALAEPARAALVARRGASRGCRALARGVLVDALRSARRRRRGVAEFRALGDGPSPRCAAESHDHRALSGRGRSRSDGGAATAQRSG
jgi:arylsulfatase A-like enzyme